MNLGESTRLALESIWANRLRSFLTLLGVIIGIAAIISTAAVINGLNKYVADQLSNMGSGVFTVSRFGIITNREDFLEAIRKNRRLEPADARALQERCPLTDVVAWKANSTGDLTRRSYEIRDVRIVGVTSTVLEIEPYEVEAGRIFTANDDEHSVPVAFLGHDVVDQLFPAVDPIGKEIRIGGLDLEVIGHAKKKGMFIGFSLDNFVMLPFSLHRKLFGSRNSISISVKAVREQDLEEAQDEVRAVLRARHHLRPGDEDDFGIVTSEGINDLWKTMSQTIFAIAMFVVGISLVVGGIVIMNIMLVSVIERTREIGVRKAVGARQRDIVQQFLIEAVLLSCIGGAIGIAIAYGVSALLRAQTPLPAEFPVWAPPVAFLVCTGIGVFFGISPARRAARLDPIEALRSE